jgi:membrane protease YdiL (CAAX protease family)
MSLTSRHRLALGLLVVTLLICNLTFPNSTGWPRVFLNVFGYLGLLVCYLIAKIKPADIGLAKSSLKSGFKYGGLAMLAIAAVTFFIFLIDKQAFKDPRYHHNLGTALYSVVILLPLKTVIFEELAFRGIGLALLYKIKANHWFASIVSSLAFGLWHVSSSVSINKYNLGGGLIIPKPLVVLSAVIATSIAGLILCELRWRSKSLLAPIMAHWSVNAFAIILASLSWR